MSECFIWLKGVSMIWLTGVSVFDVFGRCECLIWMAGVQVLIWLTGVCFWNDWQVPVFYMIDRCRCDMIDVSLFFWYDGQVSVSEHMQYDDAFTLQVVDRQRVSSFNYMAGLIPSIQKLIKDVSCQFNNSWNLQVSVVHS